MAIFLFFLLISAAAAQQRHSNISRGSSLTPTSNSSWPSPSGLYAFGFVPQSNGYAVVVFLAGISEKTVVWTANRDNNPTVSSDVVLQLTLDGRLILQQSGQSIDVVDSSLRVTSASMLDNGNFVLYDSNSRVIWQSYDHPTDTLLPGQRLSPGQELFSSASNTDLRRGIFRLKMQTDGNLIQYPVDSPDTAPYSYYSSFTDGTGNNVSLNLENDGHLYLLNGSTILKNLTQGGYPIVRTIYLMRIDVDGIVRLYSKSLTGAGNWSTIWQSVTDICAPKGLCGLNGFCVQIDDAADCRCLPGFDFVQPGNWTAGCKRSFMEEICGSNKDRRVQFEIAEVANTEWEDNSYEGLDTNTEEECKQACLDDCNCEAAFFKDSRCTKQRLPLRYGSRKLSESNVALVKTSISEHDTTGVPGNSGKKIEKGIRLDILITGISLLVLSILVLVFSWIYVSRKQALFGTYKRISEVTLVEDVGLQAFTYADLAKATNDFREELGRGASGTVYKGVLENSQKVVAVKRLEKDFSQGEREFQTEVKIIGKTYHRNLVRLLGYCLDGPNRLLVFEYMSNGSLADMLFRQDKQLSWAERIKLAQDIARGILYLHEECETQIIHCDIKPQNILMDEKGCAKISDFGLSKLLKQDESKTHTGIRGTKGYVAPEWHQRQPVNVKADVYSYGIVLLEILCGRKSVDWNLPEDEAILEEWVCNCYEAGELSKLVDKEIVEQRELERMVKIGIWSIQHEPSLRPSMMKVLQMLMGTVEIPIPPHPTSFLSSV